MNPQQNPYDFIMEPAHQPKRPNNIDFGNGKKRIVVAIGFVAGVITVLMIGFNLISSIGKANNEDLVTLSAYQTEMSRVLALGELNVTDPSLRNRFTTMRLSLITDSAGLKDLISKRGVKVSPEQIAAKKNTDTDKALETAKQNGNYNEVFLEKISTITNSYYQTLESAAAEATTQAEKDTLNTALSNMKLSAQQPAES